MSRWLLFLIWLAAAAVAGIMAYWTFAEREAVREAVAATQCRILAWSGGAALAAAVVVAAITAATSRKFGWRWQQKVFNPLGILITSGTAIAVAAWVGHTLLTSVPDEKLNLLVTDLTNRNPKLFADAGPFADKMARGDYNSGTKIDFLRALKNAGDDFLLDGRGIIDQAADPYQYPPLAGPAADRCGWGKVTERLTLTDSGDHHRRLVIIGDSSDLKDRQMLRGNLEKKRQQLQTLAATNGAQQFLRDASDRFDDLVSRLHIDDGTPEKVEALLGLVEELKNQTARDVVLEKHIAIWDKYIKAIRPALDAIGKPNDAAHVRAALDGGKELLTNHVNWAKGANSWKHWKQNVQGWKKVLPPDPFEPLKKKLGDEGRVQRDEVNRKLKEFKDHVDAVLAIADDKGVEPAKETQAAGTVPGNWTPADVEAIIMDQEPIKLRRWKGQTYPDGHEVVAVIEGHWAELWLRVNPQNTPLLKDAVRAAQAVAILDIKRFLRQYGDILRDRIATVKAENYDQPGRFREPFHTTPPFSDDALRTQLRSWLKTMNYETPALEAEIEAIPQPPDYNGRLDCTKGACAMAEKAVDCFDRVCGADSKPGDDDWKHGGLWWLIFFGFGDGGGRGFNPFDEAGKTRQSTKVKGPDGKDVEVGGVSSTDDATLGTYTQPTPAAAAAAPSAIPSPPTK